MMLGLAARMSSTSILSFLRAWGRKLVRNTSAVAASLRRISWPSSLLRSRPTLRLPRLGSSIMWLTARATGHQSRVHQATLGIALLRVLDLDDVGPPLGQDGPGDGHVRPCRQLDHPDAVHNALHDALLCPSSIRGRQTLRCPAFRRPWPPWCPRR